MSAARVLAEQLRSVGFRGSLGCDEPLAPFTTWRIGGPADLLAHPESEADLRLAVQWAVAEGLPWRVMGNGSNLLVGDAGVRGLVLRVRKTLDDLAVEAERLRVGAGASFPVVARVCASRGLAGLEFAAGIPGTLGGAVVMNAGWHEFEIGGAVASVRLLQPDGQIVVYGRANCEFDYRRSRFRGAPGVITAVELELERDDPREIRERLAKFAASRNTHHPTELPSCGSVFLKPPGDFAGRLIEQAGLKGLRVGDLQVSPKHANFFVNLGNGTAAQALELVEQVETTVRQRFGVELQREFELWT
jgi:UDP-N-acetylmuramate dehydrogenase